MTGRRLWFKEEICAAGKEERFGRCSEGRAHCTDGDFEESAAARAQLGDHFCRRLDVGRLVDAEYQGGCSTHQAALKDLRVAPERVNGAVFAFAVLENRGGAPDEVIVAGNVFCFGCGKRFKSASGQCGGREEHFAFAGVESRNMPENCSPFGLFFRSVKQREP